MAEEIVPGVRASHEERDRVVEALTAAAGDGRLTLEELDSRTGRALEARTRGELESLLTDLPATPGRLPPKELARIQVGAGSVRRDGRWQVPRELEITAASGSVVLDLTSAEVTFDTLDLDIDVRSGSLRIITRPGVEVDLDEVEISSGSTRVRPPWGADPVPVHLRVTVSGSVASGSVYAGPPRRRFVDWLLRRPPRYGPR
ncbi:hypothetical protein GCM10027589_29610 [Actinocorallia lasiicapitis]